MKADMLALMTPEVYENLKSAVELGKWQDGTVLTEEQRSNCMQVVILYETKHLPAEKRTGYMPTKSACSSQKPDQIKSGPIIKIDTIQTH